jgi:hypothetical protein
VKNPGGGIFTELCFRATPFLCHVSIPVPDQLMENSLQTDFDPPREQTATTPNSHSLDEYESHMREQLPELIRSRVEQHLDASVLRGLDFGVIIRECQEELSRTYREAATEGSISQMFSAEPEQPQEITATLNGSFEMSGSSLRHNSEFVCEVLQAPPPQADSQILDPSLEATIRDSKVLRTVDQASDSGYASMNVCACTGDCSCQSSSTSSQITTTEISNPDPRETFAGHFNTALSLQATSREARNSTLDNSPHIQDHYSQPLINFQPGADEFDHSMQSQEQALRNRSSLSDSAPTQPGGGDPFFNPRANYQYQPELSAAPLFQSTGFSFAPTPMQYSNDSMFGTSTQEDGLGRDVSWQDAIEWGLFGGPTAPNGF